MDLRESAILHILGEVKDMILADKIARMRKKNGWSQEELAGKMDVSRQAVSKWESAQSVPDLERILQLANLFEVTTDYLLKDEIEDEEFVEDRAGAAVRRVSLEEANAFLEWRRTASLRIALATFLCILSPIPLLILGAATENPAYGVSEGFAAGGGMILLLVLVSIAVALYVHCGFRNAPYAFLDREAFETEYGVNGMVRERQRAYRGTYARCNIAGACLCVLSPAALMGGALTESGVFAASMLSVTLLVAGIGVVFFVAAGVRWASMQKLLKEGEFSEQGRRQSRIKEAISAAYWLAATAVYLAWSFATDDWNATWIVWPVAGVLFAGVMALCNLFVGREEE